MNDIIQYFKLNDSVLNDAQKTALANVLDKWRPQWNKSSSQQHFTDKTEFTLEMVDETPYAVKNRSFGRVEDEIIKSHVEKMLANGVIRPSKSPWAAPVMLTDKKNGKIRFCVDYRRLNEKTVKWEYPIPRMDDILSTIAGASFYSVMDLTSAFWSIPIREQDKKYTAFTCKQGLFKWNSMPFGLKIKCSSYSTKNDGRYSSWLELAMLCRIH